MRRAGRILNIYSQYLLTDLGNTAFEGLAVTNAVRWAEADFLVRNLRVCSATQFTAVRRTSGALCRSRKRSVADQDANPGTCEPADVLTFLAPPPGCEYSPRQQSK